MASAAFKYVPQNSSDDLFPSLLSGITVNVQLSKMNLKLKTDPLVRGWLYVACVAEILNIKRN